MNEQQGRVSVSSNLTRIKDKMNKSGTRISETKPPAPKMSKEDQIKHLEAELSKLKKD